MRSTRHYATAIVKKIVHESLEKLGVRLCNTKNIIFAPEDIFMKAYLHKAASLMPGGVENVFDVGANVGRFSKLALSVFPQARVYAFEPISATYQILKDTFSGCSSVVPEQIALGQQTFARKKVYLKPNSEWNSLSNNETWVPDETKFEYVDIDTIDHFMEANQIISVDVLKTDTEGYDLQVLKGAQKALKARKIRVIIAEVGFDKRDLQHSYFSEIHEYLYELGFSVFGFTGLGAVYRCQNGVGIGYCNCVFVCLAN
jgi:FkbM family methyltransferase